MKIRVAFALTESGRFLGHLDLSRNWYRLLRRAALPLAYSQGYSPKPKLSFGSALSVGTTSAAEYVDIGLSEAMPLEEIKTRLQNAAPPAYDVTAVGSLKPGSPALMSVINRAAYRLSLHLTEPVAPATLDAAFTGILAKDSLPMTRYKKDSRKNKVVDIRPGIHALTGTAGPDGLTCTVDMMLSTGNDGNIKPDEVVYALLEENLLPVQQVVRKHRLGLYIAQHDGLETPLSDTYCTERK